MMDGIKQRERWHKMHCHRCKNPVRVFGATDDKQFRKQAKQGVKELIFSSKKDLIQNLITTKTSGDSALSSFQLTPTGYAPA